MRAWTQKWWFAFAVMGIYVGLDVCTSISTFASSMRDDANLSNMTFKEVLLLVSGVLGSMFLCIKTYISTTFHKARNETLVK